MAEKQAKGGILTNPDQGNFNMSLILNIENNVAVIKLNRPEKLNALSPDAFSQLDDLLAKIELQKEVRALVITGDERAFAAGADIDHMADMGIRDVCEIADTTVRVQERLATMPVPTIAAISGYCLGGGLELALCCDFRIATDTAVLGFPEITLGIIPGGGGTQRLPRLIGKGAALKLIMLGNRIDADEALGLGLVDQVVKVDALIESVDAFTYKLAKQPAVALRAAKSAVNNGLSVSLNQGIQMEKDLFCMLFGTEDQKEGMKAFLEKRKPSYKGK
jgi:enoyl-CoA hydratase